MRGVRLQGLALVLGATTKKGWALVAGGRRALLFNRLTGTGRSKQEAARGMTVVVGLRPPSESRGDDECRPGFGAVARWTVPSELDGATLPEALQSVAPDLFPTGSRARKACRKGKVLVNGSTGRCINRVGAGDAVVLQERQVTAYNPKGVKKPFDVDVAYEDDHLAVVFKPSGPPTVSPRGTHGGRSCMRTAVQFALKPPGIDAGEVLRRPQPVHRLDAPTSGLLVVAKTRPALLGLQRAFADRTVSKVYTALVIGSVQPPSGTVDAPLQIKFKGKLAMRDAVSQYRTVATVPSLRGGTLTLLEFRPKTGRTHQLRIHASRDLGCPIVGDSLYDAGASREASLHGKGLFLCATSIAFAHPVTGEPLRVSVPPPHKFYATIDREADRTQKFSFDNHDFSPHDHRLPGGGGGSDEEHLHLDDDDLISDDDDDDDPTPLAVHHPSDHALPLAANHTQLEPSSSLSSSSPLPRTKHPSHPLVVSPATTPAPS